MLVDFWNKWDVLHDLNLAFYPCLGASPIALIGLIPTSSSCRPSHCGVGGGDGSGERSGTAPAAVLRAARAPRVAWCAAQAARRSSKRSIMASAGVFAHPSPGLRVGLPGGSLVLEVLEGGWGVEGWFVRWPRTSVLCNKNRCKQCCSCIYSSWEFFSGRVAQL